MPLAFISLSGIPYSVFKHCRPVITIPLYFDRQTSSTCMIATLFIMSSKVRFLLSDTPLCCGVYGGVNCETIPHFAKWSKNSWLMYSPPRSDRRALMVLPSWFSTSLWKTLNVSKISWLLLLGVVMCASRPYLLSATYARCASILLTECCLYASTPWG